MSGPADACLSFRVSLLLALALIASHPSAQSSSTSIAGRIVSAQGGSLSGVLVVATHTETDFGGVALSAADGQFSIADLPAGHYTVAAEKQGYQATVTEVQAGSGQSSLEIRLARAAGLSTGPGSPPRPRNYATVQVFYGTDRREDRPGVYGGNRGTPVFGVCEVSVPRDHRTGKLESPSIWRLEFRPDPAKHVTLQSVKATSKGAFLSGLGGKLAASTSKSAFVFIHGYNVTFEDAARRTGQLAYDLGFDGPPIMYSWPSNARMVDYLADGEDSAWAAPHLEEFLRVVAEQSDAKTVHLIAHSMGNRLLTSALAQMTAAAGASKPTFNQIALVAPDIDADIFQRDIVSRIVPRGQRVTLYASSRDTALQAAKKLGAGYPRAGDLSDGAVVVDGVDTIDVSALDTSLIGHSYYADNVSVIADLFYLIGQGLAPAARFRLQWLPAERRPYWRFVP